jgi:DNA-binding NarL/FixJ family response regulator
MVSKKTILIVDDHPLLREGLKSIIARDPRFKVIGEAGNGEECLKVAKECKPDLVLMDISLPDTSGILLTRTLRKLLPEVRIIIVSMYAKANSITEAFQSGATGYVSKESATERLLEGLEAVSRGDYFLDSAISSQVVKRLMEFPGKEARIIDTGYKSLTPREQEVMRLLAEGLSVRHIAERLCISPKTVENHRANILTKLNLNSTIELIRYAARIGLIDVELWRD